jgi:hypothetical protein
VAQSGSDWRLADECFTIRVFFDRTSAESTTYSPAVGSVAGLLVLLGFRTTRIRALVGTG